MKPEVEKEQQLTCEIINSKRDNFRIDIRRKVNNNLFQEKRQKLAEHQRNPTIHYDILIELRNKVDHSYAEFIERMKERNSSKALEILQTIRLVTNSNFKKDEINCMIIDIFLEKGIVESLIGYLNQETPDLLNIKIEITWIFLNLTTGNTGQTVKMIERNLIDAYLKLLGDQNNQNIELVEHIFTGLGNLSGDPVIEIRNMILDKGAIPLIMKTIAVFKNETKLGFFRSLCHLISNLSRKPIYKYEEVRCFWGILAQLLSFEDEYIQVAACWAISYLCDGDELRINDALKSGCIPRICKLFSYTKSEKLRGPCLRTIGNISFGQKGETKILISNQVFFGMSMCLDKNLQKPFKLEAGWALSNIVAGSEDEIEAFLRTDLVDKLIKMIEEEDRDVAREYLLCLSNATSNASLPQIEKLVLKDLIKVLIVNIERFEDDKNLVLQMLEGIENILKAGEFEKDMYGYNRYVKVFENYSGHRLIEKLQHDQCHNIYLTCYRIADRFFDSETLVDQIY